MIRSSIFRTAAAAGLVGAMALTASPAAAQSVEVPGVGEITAIEDLLDLPGLDLTDPVLDEVSGVIDSLTGLLDDLLGDVPLPNLLALQGEDAIDAAIAFSQVTYEESETALLARDDLFADALTTGALQGIFDAPLLLTASGDLDRRTAQELVRLGVRHLVVVGGEDAITPLVLQKLDIAGVEVTRVGGPTRIETAAQAAASQAADATTAVLTRAYSASGDDSQAYADLLAVSPWAAQQGWPVLLTQTEVLTASVREAIAASALTEVVIIGGTGAVSQAVQDELEAMGLTVRRVAGDTRYGTAVAIAAERGFATSADTDRLILAEGTASRDDVWAPGFAAAAHAARHDAPVLLTNGAVIPEETMRFITDGMVDNLLDGGPAALCASFVDPIACEAAGLLLLGNLTDALDVLGLTLADIPGIEDLLRDLGLGDLADLLDALDGVVDGIISGVSDGDLEAIVEALTGATGSIEGIVEGVIGAETDPTEPVGTVDDLIDTVDGVLGGTDGGTDGGTVTDPIEDVVDVVDGVDGLLGTSTDDGAQDATDTISGLLGG
jgi:putative cell wall-binding protein